MARPTRSRLLTGDYSAGQPQQAPGLQVVAPLNVRTAPSSAEQLAGILGIGMDIAAPIVTRKIEEKARDSATLGRGDVSMGKVDEKRKAEDESYAAGVKRGMVDRAIVDFKSAAANFYENEFDKAQGTEALAQELDKMARGMLGGYAADPDAVRWMTGEVESTLARITGAHDAELAKQFKEDRIATAGALVRDAYQNQEGIDPEEVMTRLRPILGNSEATKAYVEIIGSLAVEEGNPDIIEALIPEKWADGTPGPRSTPALNASLNQARYYAEAARDARSADMRAAAKRDADDTTLRLTIDVLRGVDPIPSIAQALSEGVPLDAADIRSLVNFHQGQQDRSEEKGLDVVRIAELRARMLTNPNDISPQDMVQFVAANFSNSNASVTQVSMLFDDYKQAREAENRAASSPLAKAYRASLVNQYNPASYEAPSVKEVYAAGMLAFDKAIVETGDPEKALAAAKAVFEKTSAGTAAVKPTDDTVANVKAFADGKMSAADFVKAHGREGEATRIFNLMQSGQLTREQAKKAIELLSQ